MDYKQHYNTLVERRQGRLLEGYSEQHHIIPKCMGGNNHTDNLVTLTAGEHYIAHQLLVKIYPNNTKLAQAAHMMTIDPRGGRANNKSYSWLRKRHAKAMSTMMVGNTNGTGNKGKPSPRKGIPQTEKANQKRREKMQGRKTGPQSEKHKQNRRLGMLGKNKGKPSWRKGKSFGPLNEKHKEKLRKAMKGKPWSTARRAAYNKKKGVL